MTFDQRERQIALWRRYTAVARERYEYAVEWANGLALDSRSVEISNPDGGLALQQALREERAAQDEYFSAMKTCSDLLLGENPKRSDPEIEGA